MSSAPRLPYELHIQIASSKSLSYHDLAAMRLVRRDFAAPIASILFRRINISRLRADRDSFDHVAAHEHLARHVRELIWYELDLEAWDPPYPTYPPSQTTEDPPLLLDDYHFTQIQSLMSNAACDTSLFWLPRMASGDFQKSVPSSVGWFIATLDKFPHLTTFISSAMPRDRVITYDGYPMSPDLYRKEATQSQTSNSGFFFYMLEAMERAESKVRTLSWQNENHHRNGLGNNLLPKHVAAFRALTTIDLCPIYIGKEDADMMVLCLKAATNLKHLSLCHDRLKSDSCQLVLALTESCTWTTLTSLELHNVNFRRYPVAGFLKRCTGIRRLHLRECQVLLHDMLALSPRQLTSVIIIGGSHYITESSLIDIVSRGSSESLRNHTICTIKDDSIPEFLDEEEDTLHHVWDWEKPYWCWGRFGRDKVYYWQVDDIDEAQGDTTIWSFKNPDGRIVHGDPLEYYEDGGSEAGDEITPLPYGEAFDEFCRDPGTEPPPGAVHYPTCHCCNCRRCRLDSI